MLDVVRLWSVVVDYLSGIVEQVLLITRFSPSFLASHLNLIASCILIIFFIIIIALGSIHHPSIVERSPTTNQPILTLLRRRRWWQFGNRRVLQLLVLPWPRMYPQRQRQTVQRILSTHSHRHRPMPLSPQLVQVPQKVFERSPGAGQSPEVIIGST